jgi:hypothetical protein
MALGSATASARAPQVVDLGEDAAPVALAEMAANTLYFRYQISPFDEKFGYREPLANAKTAESRNNPRVRLSLFISSSSLILDLPVEKVDFSRLASIEAMRRLDDTLAPLQQVAPSVVESIDMPGLAPGASPGHWCKEAALCFEVGLPVKGPARVPIFAKYQTSTIAANGEARASDNGLPPGEDLALRELDGIDSPIHSYFKQTLFNINIRALPFARTLAIAQALPGDPGKSVVTGYFVFAIHSKRLEFDHAGFKVRDFIMGKTWANAPSGIMQGLPEFTRKAATGLADELTR